MLFDSASLNWGSWAEQLNCAFMEIKGGSGRLIGSVAFTQCLFLPGMWANINFCWAVVRFSHRGNSYSGISLSFLVGSCLHCICLTDSLFLATWAVFSLVWWKNPGWGSLFCRWSMQIQGTVTTGIKFMVFYLHTLPRQGHCCNQEACLLHGSDEHEGVKGPILPHQFLFTLLYT